MNIDKIFDTLKLNSAFLPFFKNINMSDDDLAKFIANVSEESMRLYRVKENLNYSTESRLIAVYPSKFKHGGYKAKDYLNNPVKLGNLVYSNKLGNGDINSGDGGKFLGRGLLQITGKVNYQSFKNDSGIDCISNPSILEQPKYALESALWYWHKNVGAGKTIEQTRKLINGPAMLGMDHVRLVYNQILKIM